jgi:hypothetical protein
MTPRLAWLPFALVAVAAVPAGARQGPPDYGIDFVTITSPGNTAYTTGHGALVDGRGAVAYEYRIGRFETTTAQWLEFVNTFAGQSPNHLLFVPSSWGATLNPADPEHWMLSSRPDAARIPIYGITWRDAAFYCNWLNNGKPATLDQIQDGAYDGSTFTRNPDGSFNDQRTHNPGAQFWIPTLDEALKSRYYDPDRSGPGQGGWWEFNNRSDTAPVSGPPPPGEGETSAGLNLPGFGYLYIPLGAYTNTMTPWGLFDASGGGREWTEETLEEIYGRRFWRIAEGSFAGPGSSPESDWIVSLPTEFPLESSITTLRIATVVPAPSALAAYVFGITALIRRRSRPCSLEQAPPSSS